MSAPRKRIVGGFFAFAVLGSLSFATPALGSAPQPGPAAPTGVSGVTDRVVYRGVSAIDASDAWAVGFRTTQDGQIYKTLAEHWDGQTWAKVPSPNAVGADVSDLLAVDAVSSTDVWAVGNSGVASTSNTIIEHWNGQAWSLLPSPPGEFYGVTAVSSNDVWAVGDSYVNDVARPLIMHWNGQTWATVASPVMPGHLYGVSAVNGHNVWAAGFFYNGNNRTLIEHWDGTAWTQVKSPHPKSFNELYGVSAVAKNDVWAVGEYAGTNSQKTLTEHWDGQAWTKVRSKLPPTATLPYLFGVSAASSSQVWAVGFRVNTNATLASRWNGTKWAEVASPSPDGQAILWGVDTQSTTSAWAVGGVTDLQTGGGVGLIERWNGKVWKVVPSP